MPPRSWVDKDTGHRVWRLSDEPNSGGFYFNINAYTPDNKQMIYTAPDGIHVLDMDTRATKLLVANPKQPDGTPAEGRAPGVVHAMVVGHKTNSVFYTATDAGRGHLHLQGRHQHRSHPKLVNVPKIPNTHDVSVVSVNADETLVAGTYITARPPARNTAQPPFPPRLNLRAQPTIESAAPPKGPHYQAMNKGQMMAVRLAAHLPLVLFTLRLEPGPNGKSPAC